MIVSIEVKFTKILIFHVDNFVKTGGYCYKISMYYAAWLSGWAMTCCLSETVYNYYLLNAENELAKQGMCTL